MGWLRGVRICDIVGLRWNEIVDGEEFRIREIKRGKERRIRINMEVEEDMRDCYEDINGVGINGGVLMSEKGRV